MQSTGTLDIYVTTQLLDYVFILTIACIGLFVCTFGARFSRSSSVGRKLGLLAGLALVAGAVCDAIENGLSFIMLANPNSFADWLALPYSTFASVKFALITLGMGMFLLSLCSAVLGRVLAKPKIG